MAGKAHKPQDYPGHGKRAWEDAFIEAFAQTGVVKLAAAVAGIDRRSVFYYLRKSPGFTRRYNDALDQAADTMEAEAIRRGVKGCKRPVFYLGKKCGSTREFSDTLLIFLLKAARPEKFRDNYDVQKLIEAIQAGQVVSFARNAKAGSQNGVPE